jgi:hypothetical protein
VLTLVISAAIVALAGAWVPGLARADGDPASDVLVTQSVFLPADAGASAGQQSELTGVLGEAQKVGMQIRVAVIASQSDLGSVTALWRQPGTYAQFLGEELSLVYHGRVLVVMPDGFGFSQGGVATSAGRGALAAVPAPGPRGVVEGAIAAVQHLAAASGHSLSAPTAAIPSSSSATSNSSSTIEWVVFAIGSGLIAAAWIVSLRLRPLRSDDGKASAA